MIKLKLLVEMRRGNHNQYNVSVFPRSKTKTISPEVMDFHIENIECDIRFGGIPGIKAAQRMAENEVVYIQLVANLTYPSRASTVYHVV